ncbi:conserved hypothetical protein [Candidatus Denitrolinea symbiosum]|nr:conserved hypothetical protein [Candidatus Denitrolinea symbiosum]
MSKVHAMSRRSLLLLFLLGLAVPLAIAQFQSLPGYMDADYYFGGGVQLARGNGFTEPYLWNYLSDPRGLPTPSHAYWMPLASILAAAGMWLTGQTTFASARIGFILLAALVPPLTSLLAFRLTSNRAASLLSGLLACFPIYYAPFLPVPDNYAIYMLLGIAFFLLLSNLQSPTSNLQSPITFLLLGLVSALASLARSDGLLWLGMSLLAAVWFAGKQINKSTTQADSHTSTSVRLPPPASRPPLSASCLPPPASRPPLSASCLPPPASRLPPSAFRLLPPAFCVLAGFLLLMSPWYARNLAAFGSFMAPGSSRALWLTSYNDTFAYPASQLTMTRWLASGWDAILLARAKAGGVNLLNAFAAQGGIFLFPFILAGLWILRRDLRVRFAALAWILLFAAMTLVFPFAGPRGAFFHAGAALQPMWWSLAPVGLDAAVAWARRRGRFDDRAFAVFRGALVGIAALMTVAIFAIRVLPNWEREDGHYAGVETLLLQQGAPSDGIVIVRNPPGYNIVTGRAAIALPTGGLASVLAVAERYDARYLVLEPLGTTGDLRELYDHPDQFPEFIYLGEADDDRLYEIVR